MNYFTGIVLVALQSVLLLHYLTYIQAAGYGPAFKEKLGRTAFNHWAGILLFGIAFAVLYGILDNKCFNLVLLLASSGCFIALVFMYVQKRNKLKLTPRARRLLCLCLIPAVLSYLTVLINGSLFFMISGVLCTFLCPLYAAGFCLLMAPLEKKNNQKYLDAAVKKLNSMPLLIKIGITGSYGKTSCKNILAKLLENGFKVYATQGNFNTPLGIARSVGDMPADTDIFIAEMGARRKGDIKELAEMVKPQHGILTGLAEQHLKTFGSFKNICEEKAELLKALPPDGIGVLNGNDVNVRAMAGTFKAFPLIAGFGSKYCSVYADNIEVHSLEGSGFDLIYGDGTVSCRTPLIGKHNIENIVLCAALALKLGINPEDIRSTIGNLKPVPHRMEVIETGRLTIIDDSYNCNIKGAQTAAKFLQGIDRRRVVYTQGIVEGGDKSPYINSYLGELIAPVCDAVILSGINAADIKKGLERAVFKGEIYEFKSLKSAQKEFKNILHDGDVLYLQNDIPDNI